jgi:hypothetical protein
MKRFVLSVVLISLLAPTGGVCGEFAEQEEMESQMEMREMEMELEDREAESSFNRQMRELELEERMLELERAREGHKDEMHPLLLLVVVVHILVAVWVYTDIRKLNRGSGIWIVIALLTGLLGTLVYAVVRMGDARTESS